MSSKLRIIAIVVGILVLLLLVAPFLIPVNAFRPEIEEKIGAAVGRKVEVGNLSLSLIGGSLTAENLSIADDPKFGSSPFLTAKSLHVGVEMVPLILSRSLRVTGISIDQPEVNLLRDAAGKWNFSSLGPAAAPAAAKAPRAPAAAPEFSVQKMNLNDGRITIGSAKSRKRSLYDKVSVEASGVSMTSQFPVKVTASLPGGGSLKLDGKMGPINVKGDREAVNEKDASLSPLEAKLTVNGMDLARTGVLDPSQGLGGLLDLDATLSSRNGEAHTQGTAKLTRLMLIAGGSPSTVPVSIDLSTNYDTRKDAGVLNPSTIKIGSATAHLSGTYETPEDATVLNIKLEGENLPARDLEAFLPAIAIHLPRGASLQSGTLNANLLIQGPTNKLVTNGTVGLYSAKLAGFDLGSRLSAIAALAGVRTGSDLDIQQLATTVHMAPNGLRAENFNAIFPALGTLTGAGTIDAKNNLDFKMIATLAHSSAAAGSSAGGAANAAEALGGLLGQLGGGGAGASKGTRIPFLIQGTTSDPKFIPDVAGLAGAMLKSQLRGSGQPSGTSQPANNPLGALGDLLKKKKP